MSLSNHANEDPVAIKEKNTNTLKRGENGSNTFSYEFSTNISNFMVVMDKKPRIHAILEDYRLSADLVLRCEIPFLKISFLI